jgi:hypothetical protein
MPFWDKELGLFGPEVTNAQANIQLKKKWRDCIDRQQ